MSAYLVRQLAEMREQVAELKRGKVTHRAALVTTADAGTSTFAATLPDGQVLSGVVAPEQFLPEAGQLVRLRLEGATPIYEPAGIAENAVTGREIEAVLTDPDGVSTSIDETGVANYAVGDDALPMELGRLGRGWSVRNPSTGLVVSSGTDDGEIAARTITTTDPDPSFGGVLLSEHDWNKPWGLQAYSKYPLTGGNSALTNTELGFMELGFDAVPGRAYAVFIEGVQPINVTSAGGWMLRVRNTIDGTAPTVSSNLLRQYSSDGTVDVGWNTMAPQCFLYNGPVLGDPQLTVRFLFTYAAGTGAAPSQGAGIYRDRNIYFWIEDVGPQVPETGDETSGGGTAVSGTPPPSGGTTTKQNYTYEAAANWQRTWGQNNSSIVIDSEMQQGYADSFNGHRRSSAGWTGLPTLLSGATVTEVAFYVESYHWYNMSGGTLRMGYHGVSAEPATFPGQVSPGNVGFTARAQGKWITRNDWAAGVKSGAIRGISFLGTDNSATYYGKFRGEGYGSGRPRIRVKYTK